MRIGNFDKFHHRQPAVVSSRRWSDRLFRSPIAIVLLVWGFLFLILGVASALPQEIGNEVKPRNAARGRERDRCDKKTEVVEIFSVGEELVIRPQVKNPSSRRSKIAVGRVPRR